MAHPSFSHPLVDTREILTYLDQSRSSGDLPSLTPTDPREKDIVDKLIALVHSDDVGTNLILLQARNEDEMEVKKKSPFHDYIGNRQKALESYQVALPEHPFYPGKSQENGMLNRLYETETGPEHEKFFQSTQEGYRKFAAGMDQLESLLVLPYAAGDNVTLADLHIVPWMSHAMWGVGTTNPEDFGKLEEHIRKTVPQFRIGMKTREWWLKFGERESFRKVYAKLH